MSGDSTFSHSNFLTNPRSSTHDPRYSSLVTFSPSYLLTFSPDTRPSTHDPQSNFKQEIPYLLSKKFFIDLYINFNILVINVVVFKNFVEKTKLLCKEKAGPKRS
jgi:hypothetical protein